MNESNRMRITHEKLFQDYEEVQKSLYECKRKTEKLTDDLEFARTETRESNELISKLKLTITEVTKQNQDLEAELNIE